MLKIGDIVNVLDNSYSLVKEEGKDIRHGTEVGGYL